MEVFFQSSPVGNASVFCSGWASIIRARLVMFLGLASAEPSALVC